MMLLLLVVVVPMAVANPTGTQGEDSAIHGEDSGIQGENSGLQGEDHGLQGEENGSQLGDAGGQEEDPEAYCRYACDGEGGCATTYTGAPPSLPARGETVGTCPGGHLWGAAANLLGLCFNIPPACRPCNQVVACTGASREVVPHRRSWWERHATTTTEMEV